MEKWLVFDLDGTLADLYNVNNWLEKLNNEDESPYLDANPLYNMELLNSILLEFRKKNWKIAIVTWLAMNATKAYDDKVRKAKKQWIEKYNLLVDEIHMVKYGTTKAKCTKHHKNSYQILIDDNKKIRQGWHLGNTINAKENILVELNKILANEKAA